MKPKSIFFLSSFYRHIRMLFFLLIMIVGAFFLSFLFLGKSIVSLECKKIDLIDYRQAPSLPEIFGSSLSTNPLNVDLCFKDLTDQMQVLLFEARPDDPKNTHYFEISLTPEGPSRIVNLNEIVYLKFHPETNGYEFSQKPTDFWFIPSLFHEIIKLKFYAKYTDLNGLEIKKESEIDVIAQKNEKNLDLFQEDKDLLSLKEAKWLGADLFEERYGVFEGKKIPKQRLFFNNAYICEVTEGNIIVNKDGIWQNNASGSQGCAIAEVKVVTPKTLELDVWQKEGLNKQRIVYGSSPPASALSITDDFITEIRQRTLKQISCKLEKQRIIMKEKDVLLKKDGKWKISKLPLKQEKEACEVFVFESIENQASGKTFKGCLFNKDRTQMLKIQKDIIFRAKNPQHKKRRY
jgi:hypothetical protein